SKRDPEFGVIQKIKEQILKAEIQAVFHMHDGSGFYREQYINETFNPKRWGNCSIIDQDSINVEPFGNLKEIVEQIVAHTNTGLLKSFHKYHIHNTHTAIKDKQMQKSLTYFAITNGKPAFAHEASKTLPLRERVYYHLLGIEGFLQAVGVEFERNFDLTPKTIASLINDKNLTLTIDSSITIPLFHLKSPINFFPIPLSAKGDVQNLALESKSYILGLSPEGDFKADSMVFLKYGNRTMARIKPLYLEFDKSLEHIDIQVDGKRQEVKIGSILKVKDNFYLHNKDGYRANVIGFIKPNDIAKKPQEFDVLVQKKAMLKKFALDINAKLYRVEFYKGNAFSGMILVEFE
ncbi:MAG: purine-nucleoside phosphorylase, partial [Helicobacter sp.]|nr:purine-nucleoside phosphorylase [Helicobacter sp.]